MDLHYAVDLARGVGPLTFDRAGDPNGHMPAVIPAPDGPVLRLAVQAGTYDGAIRGEPEICDRCEMREPAKLSMQLESWHGFNLRIPRSFPDTGARFVAAQMKANNGDSPLFALRIAHRRLFVDWRLGDAAFAHHDSLPWCGVGWADLMLGFGPSWAELWVDGRLVTAARADFAAITATRYLKIGPYRDKHPSWGAAPAALDFRDIRRGSTRASISRDAAVLAA